MHPQRYFIRLFLSRSDVAESQHGKNDSRRDDHEIKNGGHFLRFFNSCMQVLLSTRKSYKFCLVLERGMTTLLGVVGSKGAFPKICAALSTECNIHLEHLRAMICLFTWLFFGLLVHMVPWISTWSPDLFNTHMKPLWKIIWGWISFF